MSTRRTLLIVLRNVHPFLISEQTAWVDARALNPRLTISDVRAALTDIEAHRLAVSQPVDDETKFRITDLGLAELRNLES